MRPIGWTAESMRGRCEACNKEVSVTWDLYFDAIEYERPVRCPACGAEQPMRDRRERTDPVSVERRRP